ncbi:LysR family transcriptional regulator [Glutamicibacter halophytocola]|uniref:LysR family transcriptional regulator n=1 Tax=Glutamicibacter halophytocola TaxID=1933880 RepID=A0ABX5Y964_9MICC|nr:MULTISPECIES: LysR substrate-binding domain-containing protein [Glutamicibacter]MBF6670897.1 LysR family transcriptional regulator [Glutamicibacter sp. FBE19]NQD40097.1 LysR family transcriptional regulator [Glutamicibacter halophytocola]QDY66212.1 LysR family transcriptional regulator [Glutamicibacter halophytocola]
MARTFTLVQLRYFIEIARLENMRAAATSLNVSQSTLSSALSQLEHDLGAQLFLRLPNRALKLSEDGKRLVAGARILLEDAETLQTSLSGHDDQLSGKLRVGIFAPLAPFIAPRLLGNFRVRYPKIELQFVEGEQQQVLEALGKGECEIALMYDLGVGAEFSMESVDRLGAHIIVGENHRLAERKKPISLSELVEEPLVLLDQVHSREYFLKLFSSLDLEPNVAYWVSGYETVRSYVAMGLGYSILNRRMPHNLTYTGSAVVPLSIAEPVIPISVVVAHVKEVPMTRKARVFAELAREILNDG